MVNLLLNSGANLLKGKSVTYLTQWKIVGNSQVHTDPYLTSWKVSGNSVVDNNAILSCGDLGQDGKYHVKISNDIDIYDITLTEPLRKVNDIADTIEFANGVTTLTRRIKSYVLSNTPEWFRWPTAGGDKTIRRYVSSNTPLVNGVRPPNTNVVGIALCAIYPTVSVDRVNGRTTGISIETSGRIGIYDADYAEEVTNDAFVEHIQGVEVYYQLATPITELVDTPQIAVSPTDTYTSANATPYSAFEHTENKEIWSCGEYNATDGKYHILVQPLGGSIADIALTEPLRKVNDVADSIEFPSDTEGKALVTRNLALFSTTKFVAKRMDSQNKLCLTIYKFSGADYDSTKDEDILCNKIENGLSLNNARKYDGECFALQMDNIYIRNGAIEQTLESYQSYFDNLGAIEVVYQLASPTTELVDAPQIQEADSYTCEISQGGKAVSWSSFETD